MNKSRMRRFRDKLVVTHVGRGSLGVRVAGGTGVDIS